MRIIKIILGIIGVLVIITVATGLLVPTFEYGNSIVVNASPVKCWSVSQDTSRMKNWMDGFKSLTLQKGITLEPGSTYLLVIDQNEKMEMQVQIVSAEEPNFISYELNNDVLKSEYTYSFNGSASQTTIATKYTVTGNNVFMKAILFFSKSYLEGNDKKQLEGLKNEIESR